MAKEELGTMDNFSISNTMDMGMGNQELLDNLYAPETASGNPEEITSIIKEVIDPVPAVPAEPKGKVINTLEEGASEEEKSKNSLTNFLNDAEEEVTKEVKNDSNIVEQIINDENDSRFTALANDLFTIGVFNKKEDEEEIITPEQFKERFELEKKEGASEIVQNFIGQFGQDYQDAFDAIFVKGADPKEYFTTYNNVVNFAEMDMTLENNQEKVMRQALTNQGFESEDIDSEIERLKNYGDLADVSVKNHKVLVKQEAVKLQEIESNAQAELQQKQNIKNQYIKNVTDILTEKIKTKEFDGLPVNQKIANELQDYLLVDKWKTPSGELLSDFDKAILDLKRPENHNMKVKLGLILKMLEKDPTLSTIQKTGVTKKSDTLFAEVARQVVKDKNPVSSGIQSSWNL